MHYIVKTPVFRGFFMAIHSNKGLYQKNIFINTQDFPCLLRQLVRGTQLRVRYRAL